MGPNWRDQLCHVPDYLDDNDADAAVNRHRHHQQQPTSSTREDDAADAARSDAGDGHQAHARA